QSARHDEPDVVLLQDVRGAVADARLRAGVRHAVEAEGALVEVGGLLRIAHPELEVVPALDRHEVLSAHDRILTGGSPSPGLAKASGELERLPGGVEALGSARARQAFGRAASRARRPEQRRSRRLYPRSLDYPSADGRAH